MFRTHVTREGHVPSSHRPSPALFQPDSISFSFFIWSRPCRAQCMLFPLLGMPFLYLSAQLTPTYPVSCQQKGHSLQEAFLRFPQHITPDTPSTALWHRAPSPYIQCTLTEHLPCADARRGAGSVAESWTDCLCPQGSFTLSGANNNTHYKHRRQSNRPGTQRAEQGPHGVWGCAVRSEFCSLPEPTRIKKQPWVGGCEDAGSWASSWGAWLHGGHDTSLLRLSRVPQTPMVGSGPPAPQKADV